jgi:hypothetical protein
MIKLNGMSHIKSNKVLLSTLLQRFQFQYMESTNLVGSGNNL